MRSGLLLSVAVAAGFVSTSCDAESNQEPIQLRMAINDSQTVDVYIVNVDRDGRAVWIESGFHGAGMYGMNFEFSTNGQACSTCTADDKSNPLFVEGDGYIVESGGIAGQSLYLQAILRRYNVPRGKAQGSGRISVGDDEGRFLRLESNPVVVCR